MKIYFTILVIFMVCFSIWYYSMFNNKENLVLPYLKIDKLEMRIDSLEYKINKFEKVIEEHKSLNENGE